MTSATVDVSSADHSLSIDSLPFVDLRLFSQCELDSLSLCSSSSSVSSRRDHDLLIPKIDRSVFNESAGSRKQTFSRLRLAPRNSQTPISAPHPATPRQTADQENARVISLLKQLFAVDSSCNADGYDDVDRDLSLVPIEVQFNDSVPGSLALALHSLPVDVLDVAPRKRKRGRPRKNENVVSVTEVEKGDKKPEKSQGVSEPIVMVHENGDFVDLAALASLDDPFAEELKRRTQGMETESELLEFLGRLNGEWGSQRKKRRIVQACDFGAFFPRGWKIMLSLKRKAGHVLLSCCRYISPDGHQFVSCKEVSSYLLSFFGLNDANSSRAFLQEGTAQIPGTIRNIHVSSACPDQDPHMDPGIARQIDTCDKVNDGPSSGFSSITSGTYTGKGHSSGDVSDDKMENEMTNDICCKTNFHLLATTSFSNESNLLHQRLDELNHLRFTSNGTDNFVRLDESFGSCSLASSESEQVCGDDNKVNVLSNISVVEPVQEIVTQSYLFPINFQKKHASGEIENENVMGSMKDVNIPNGNQLGNEKASHVSSHILPMVPSGGSQLAGLNDECEHAYHDERNEDSVAFSVGSLMERDSEDGVSGAAIGGETYLISSELNKSLSISGKPSVKEVMPKFSLCGGSGNAGFEMQQKGTDKKLFIPYGSEHALDIGSQNNVESPDVPKPTKIIWKSTDLNTSIKQESSEACLTNASSQSADEASYAIKSENDALHLEELTNKKVEYCDTTIAFPSFSCSDGDSDAGNVKNKILDVSKDSSIPHYCVDRSFCSERDFGASSSYFYVDEKSSSLLKNSNWVNAMAMQKQQQADGITGNCAGPNIASETDFSSRKDGQNFVTYTSSSQMSLPCSPNSDIMANKGGFDIISGQNFDSGSICCKLMSDRTGNVDSLSSEISPLVEHLEDFVRDAEAERGKVSSGYLGFDKQKVDNMEQVKFSKQSCL